MKRVMILSKRSTLWLGVQRVLQDAKECDLVGWETEFDGALERIRELRPDVVLVDRGEAGVGDASPLLRILGEGLGTRVIALSVEDSTLSLYSGERRTVNDEEDLIRAIEGAPAVLTGADERDGQASCPDSFPSLT